RRFCATRNSSREQGSWAATGLPLAMRVGWGAMLEVKVGLALPLVLDVAHDQGAVELDAAIRKLRFIGEITRVDTFNLQRFDVPGLRAQFDAIQSSPVFRGRVTDRSRLKESARFGYRCELRRRGQGSHDPGPHSHDGFAIPGLHFEVY